MHDEFMKDDRLFILGDSWGRKRRDGGPQTKKPTKNNLPSNSDFIHQGEDFHFKVHQGTANWCHHLPSGMVKINNKRQSVPS